MKVEIYPDRIEMGRRAAACAAAEIRTMIEQRGEAVIMLAAAASQLDFLSALGSDETIDWPKVTVLHVDEYIGLDEKHPASFRLFLKKHLVVRVPVRAFHGVLGDAPDPAAECARYTELLRKAQPGLAVLGIGENGHLAFNDPAGCDFNDPRDVRVVELDEVCRRQQVHDKAFERIEDVPKAAITLTVPALMRVPRLLVVVPGALKAQAVRAALEGPLTTDCPASILRQHANATLFLDQPAASLLSGKAASA